MANKSHVQETLSLNGVTIKVLDRNTIKDVQLSLKVGEAVVIRGESGAGKSILLKAIAGETPIDSGTIVVRTGSKRQYVSTSELATGADGSSSIREYFFESRGLAQIEKQKEELEEMMGSGKSDAQTLQRYGEVLEKYEILGGFTADAEIKETIEGLKITGQNDRPITSGVKLSEVSSGQRSKLAVGRAIFSNAKLVVLDEPTAHLDPASVDWFTKKIARDSKDKSFVIATNDDRVAQTAASQILQIENTGRTLTFRGSLAEFNLKRESLLEAEATEREILKRKEEKLNNTFLTFKREGAFERSADFAATGRSMKTRLDRMNQQLQEMPEVQRSSGNRPKLTINNSGRVASDSSIVINGVVKKYSGGGGVDLSKFSELRIKQGDKVVIKGENGAGKSTLLKVINSQVTGEGEFGPDSGTVRVANSNQKVAYYSPDSVSFTSQHTTILAELVTAMDVRNESHATATLLALGFDKHAIRRQHTGSLSGSERQKLALAKLIVTKPDVLILDEPTSNLPPDVKATLAAALNDYAGTVIMVDHDPLFIGQIKATKSIDISPLKKRS